MTVIKTEEQQPLCLTTSSTVQPGVQWGFDDLGVGATATQVAATVATDRNAAWIIAARFTDQDGAEHFGLWATTYDPTTEVEQAMLSINDAASKFSSYFDARAGDFNFDPEEPGAPQAIACLFG